MVKEAVFHKMNQEYAFCVGEHRFGIRIRTKKNDVNEVNIVVTDKYLYIAGKREITKVPCKKVATDHLFDYYEGEIESDSLVIKYYFELIDTSGKPCYYGVYEFFEEPITNLKFFYDIPNNARSSRLFEPVEWMQDGIVYQIFPERFHRGSRKEASIKAGNEENLTDWNAKPSFADKFGGTIKGITEKLDYLKELGVTVLYFTPIFKAPSNHKYDTTDYMQIDPDFGTEEDLKELTGELHERGMKLILDGVFNHSGWTFAPFRDVMEKQEKSEYKDWFQIHKFPIGPIERGVKPNYGAFSYYGGMPQLNPDSPAVREYVSKMIAYWMGNFQIDGWRLDVADEVTPCFWQFFREEVKRHKKDAVIIGEIWYDSSAWLQGDQFDTVMNYPFHTAVTEWIANKQGKAEDFSSRLGFVRGNYHNTAVSMLWNLIGSHDCARFLTACGEDKRKLKMAVALQMAWTGAPMIYYGDEVGMTGGEDPDCRRGMVWEEERQDKELFSYYQRWISLRKQHEILRRGDAIPVLADNEKNLVVLKKEYKEQELLILIYNNEGEQEISIEGNYVDLFTGKEFEGNMEPYSVRCLLKKTV